MQDINRLKVILVERNKIGKCLVEAIGKNEATVFTWCSCATQPPVGTFVQIAEALEWNVDVRELLM
jgi:hypothetical protein